MTSGTRRVVLVVAGFAALLVVILAVPVLLGRLPGSGSWQCTSLDVYDGSNTGPTARAALEAYLRSAGAPRDGWNLAEPNRFSRSNFEQQRVVSVNQTATDTWVVVRSESCAR